MVTKRSHILKQTCSFQMQVCLSMCDLLLPQGIEGLKDQLGHYSFAELRQSSKFKMAFNHALALKKRLKECNVQLSLDIARLTSHAAIKFAQLNS